MKPLRRLAGFTLLPVVLGMSLIGAIAFLLNRDNGMNAEMVSSQTDTDRARYAAEAGLQAVNAQVQGLSCAGGFPLAASPVSNGSFGGASYAAYATSATGNSVGLVSTGSYNGASVTLTRSNVTVYRSGVYAAVLQPGPGPAQETHVNPSAPNLNYGAATALQLWSGNAEILLKFDLSVLPAGSRVIPYFSGGALQPGATVALYRSSGPGSGLGNPISAYMITRSWTEGTKTGTGAADGATWNTYDGVNAWPAPGAGYNGNALSSVAYVNATTWNTWDITDAAAAWASGAVANNGVWIRPSGASINNVLYVSADDPVNLTQRPKLTANYLVPCGTPLTSAHALSAVADATLDQNLATANFGVSNPVRTLVKGAQDKRIVVQFDVTSIPVGRLITSAILRYRVASLNTPSASPKPIIAYKLTQSWLEGTKNGVTPSDGASWQMSDGVLNWTTPGGTFGAGAIAPAREESSGLSPPPATFTSGWLTWDLTALVQEWVDGVSANNGVVLIAATPNNADEMLFDSREASAGVTPQLVVTY